MTFSNSQKTGVLVTVLFHAIVFLLLLYYGFVAPFPPPPEEGFLVDFGNSATGLGLEEPSAAEAPEAVAVPAEKKIVAVSKPVSQPRHTPKVADKGDEDLLTQEYEKTVAIAVGKKKKALEERKLKEREESEKRAEALEQQRQEAAENRLQQEKEQKIGAINSRAKNAFGGGKTDNGSTSRGQGQTYGSGNQGSPDGTPGANQYGLGGGAGKGVSFSLSGRNAQSLPKPAFPGNESGKVVVEVTVDKYGKETKALPGIKGSNTINPDLLEAAKKAALSASFNSDPNAPAFQKGTITYLFKLQ